MPENIFERLKDLRDKECLHIEKLILRAFLEILNLFKICGASIKYRKLSVETIYYKHLFYTYWSRMSLWALRFSEHANDPIR